MWDALNLTQLSNLKSHISGVFCFKYGLNRLYSCGTDGKIYYYNTNTSSDQNHNKSKIFYEKSIALSIKFQLIAFGAKSLNIYCLKNDIQIGSVAVQGIITCLSFVKSIIVCGTIEWKVYLIDGQLLNVRKQFKLTDSQIYYSLVSKDYQLLAYSTKNKSRIIDFQEEQVL